MLSRMSPGMKSVVLIVLGLAFAGFGFASNAPLGTDTAPWGIASLEFAMTEARATQIIQSWQDKFQNSMEPAFASLLIDWLLLIPLYVALLGLACFWTRDKLYGENGEAAQLHPDRLYMRNMLTVLGWLQIAAGGLDYLENGAMWVMLSGPVAQPWPTIAALCAAFKFIFILAAVPYAVAYIAVSLLKWRRPSPSAR